MSNFHPLEVLIRDSETQLTSGWKYKFYNLVHIRLQTKKNVTEIHKLVAQLIN